MLRKLLKLGVLGSGGAVSGPPAPDPIIFSSMNTSFGLDLSADGFTWAQAPGIVQDIYGNVIVSAQAYRSNVKRNIFMFNNASTNTWVDNATINDLGDIGEIMTRISFCYDPVRDCLHGILHYNAEVTVYRRYDIVRSGQDITSIQWDRDTHPNTVLWNDGTSNEMYHPICFVQGNYVYASIGLNYAGGSDTFLLRVDVSGNIDSGATNANWVNIGYVANANVQAPSSVTGYTTVRTNGVLQLRHHAAIATHSVNNKLLVVTNEDASSATRRINFRQILRNGGDTGWTSTGIVDQLFTKVVSADDLGYSLKRELTTKIVDDGTDFFVACPVWVNGGSGDTVKLFKVSAASLTSVDVYGAGGAHSYAPTCDIAFIDGIIYVTYLKSGGAGTYIKRYDPATLTEIGTEVLIYDAADSDIPLILNDYFQWNGRNYFMVIFRIAGSEPQNGVCVLIDKEAMWPS